MVPKSLLDKFIKAYQEWIISGWFIHNESDFGLVGRDDKIRYATEETVDTVLKSMEYKHKKKEK
jgi:hypothetical protein